jgi:hypothetical protein
VRGWLLRLLYRVSPRLAWRLGERAWRKHYEETTFLGSSRKDALRDDSVYSGFRFDRARGRFYAQNMGLEEFVHGFEGHSWVPKFDSHAEGPQICVHCGAEKGP